MERKTIQIVKLTGIACAAALIIVLFGNYIADGLRILFGAGVICFLISPLERLLAKRIPAPWSAILALAIVAILLAGIAAATFPRLIEQISGSGSALTAAIARLTELWERAEAWISDYLPSLSLPEMDLSSLEGSIANILQNAAGYVGSMANDVYMALLMVAIGYYFMADRERTLIRMELIVPERLRRFAVRFGSALMHELRLYLRGQATIALAVGALACLGLLLLGIPNAPILGAVVGIFNVIPYFGPVLGGIPAVLMAVGISWNRALMTVAMLFLVQQIDGLVISPRVMGSITGFSPGVVLIALYFGSRISGVWGMLLAMPVLMAYRTLYRVFVQRYEMN